MEPSDKHTETSLRQQSSILSDYSIGSTSTVVASPTSPSFRRPGYHRVPTTVEEGVVPSVDRVLHTSSDNGRGLGIVNLESPKHSSVSRVPVGSKSSPGTPGSVDPLISPVSAKSAYPEDDTPRDDQADDAAPSNPYQPFSVDSERERLNGKSYLGGPNEPNLICKARKHIATGPSSWLYVSIITLSIYSTCFSGAWLFLAIVKPRYRNLITDNLSYQTASIMCAAIAKTIELSFVTIVVALIGQILSKRALGDRKNITIAEMSMRSWVLQPGTMIAHWESVRFAAVTYLGAIILTAALMAMVYTTASDALVSPKLKMGDYENKLLYGRVSTSFANTYTIMDRCTTPISEKVDPDYGQTCIQLQHSGDAYHNYMQYLAAWTENIAVGNSSKALNGRPPPVGMLYDNTTVKGSWIHQSDMGELSSKYDRIVNNVTMAMPHSGVFGAARDPRNGIVQPQDLRGLGEYYIQASVPSPVVNVLCAGMTAEDLKPMVYTNWTTFNGTAPNSTTWPNNFNLTVSPPVETPVDDLFGFGGDQVYPIFPNFPIPFNTVFNATNFRGAQAVYLLATTQAGAYTMCSIRVALTPNCSTEYHVTGSGGTLSTNCDPGNRLAYNNSKPEAPNGVWDKDWKDVASVWGTALSLNNGIADSKSSNARLLTQFIPLSTTLDESIPSISEALAVLAGNTLLSSALESPFIHWWNYSTTVNVLEKPQYQAFQGAIKTMTYQSGGSQRWERMFYVVLLLVFVANLCCLVYFFVSGHLVTDFIEPQNLFCLSLLSPPSVILEGTCAGGPENRHYSSGWNIKLDRSRDHFSFESSDKSIGLVGRHKHKWSSSTQQTEYEMEGSPVARMYSRIRKKRSSML